MNSVPLTTSSMANEAPSGRVALSNFVPTPNAIDDRHPQSISTGSRSNALGTPVADVFRPRRPTQGLMDAVLSEPLQQAKKRKRSNSVESVYAALDLKGRGPPSPERHDNVSDSVPDILDWLEDLVPDDLDGGHELTIDTLGDGSTQAHSLTDIFADQVPNVEQSLLNVFFGNNSTQARREPNISANPVPNAAYDWVTDLFDNISSQAPSSVDISADPVPKTLLLERPIGLPLGSPPLLRRTLTCFLPAALGGALKDASLLYDPYSGDLSVSICMPFDMMRPVVRGSEDTWMPGHKISGIFLMLGLTAQARHYQTALWVIHWARCFINASVKGIIVNVPLTCSILTDAEIKRLYDPVSFSGGQVASSPLFPNMHTLLWVGDARLLPSFLANVTSHSLRVIQIQSQLCVKDAQWLVRRFTTTKIHTLEIGSLSDEGRSVLLPDREADKENVKNRAFTERSRFSLPRLDTLKLKLYNVADLGAFFNGMSLPKLCKLEVDLADTPTAAGLLLHLTKTSVFGENLKLMNLVCEEKLLKCLPFTRIGTDIKDRLPKGALIQFIDRAGHCYSSYGGTKGEN